MVFNEIHGFPGFLAGAPGALEISRRREIAQVFFSPLERKSISVALGIKHYFDFFSAPYTWKGYECSSIY